MEVHHTAVLVSDLEETTAFYEDGLGLEYAWDFVNDDGVHNYYVTGEELDTWIQFSDDPDVDEVDPSGIAHLAVMVDDPDAVFERVVERTGCPVVMEPTDVPAADARVAFVTDPDGYDVEIFTIVD